MGSLTFFFPEAMFCLLCRPQTFTWGPNESMAQGPQRSAEHAEVEKKAFICRKSPVLRGFNKTLPATAGRWPENSCCGPFLYSFKLPYLHCKKRFKLHYDSARSYKM